MDDYELELMEEQDREQRARDAAADADTVGVDAPDEPDEKEEDAPGELPQAFGEMSRGLDAEEILADAVDAADKDMTADPPDADELEETLSAVTALGLDEDVLGREGMRAALADAEAAEARGESFAKGFADSAERYIHERSGADRVDTGTAAEDSPPPAPDEKQPYRERYEEHKEAYDTRYETAVPWPRDSIDAYHRMAMTYNAYKAGEPVGNVEVTKVDVFLSGVRFYQSSRRRTALKTQYAQRNALLGLSQ